jgi:hypothetical protein
MRKATLSTLEPISEPRTQLSGVRGYSESPSPPSTGERGFPNSLLHPSAMFGSFSFLRMKSLRCNSIFPSRKLCLILPSKPWQAAQRTQHYLLPRPHVIAEKKRKKKRGQRRLFAPLMEECGLVIDLLARSRAHPRSRWPRAGTGCRECRLVAASGVTAGQLVCRVRWRRAAGRSSTKGMGGGVLSTSGRAAF